MELPKLELAPKIEASVAAAELACLTIMWALLSLSNNTFSMNFVKILNL